MAKQKKERTDHRQARLPVPARADGPQRALPLAGGKRQFEKKNSIFPDSWRWFVDVAIPTVVKERYGKNPSWANKPFSRLDAEFYFRGLRDLSDLFTLDRDHRLPGYFRQPRYRSSYLLYYVPLHAAKFLALLYQEDGEGLRFKALKNRALDRKELRILDLGSGPGTATLAFLLYWIDRAHREPALSNLKIRIDWLDQHDLIMKDGIALIQKLQEKVPALKDRIEIHPLIGSWPEWAKHYRNLIESSASPSNPPVWDIVLMGNVLNEKNSKHHRESQSNAPDDLQENIKQLVATSTLGVLLVEPAAKGPAQLLSRVRDHAFGCKTEPATEADSSQASARPAAKPPVRPWSPCLHAQKCPMSEGREWCHFSIPTRVPGVWFKTFSKMLSSEKEWIKYSSVWLPSHHCSPSPVADAATRLVISNPIRIEKDGRTFVLLCEPDHPKRLPLPSRKKDSPSHLGPFRGERITLQAESVPGAERKTMQRRT